MKPLLAIGAAVALLLGHAPGSEGERLQELLREYHDAESREEVEAAREELVRELVEKYGGISGRLDIGDPEGPAHMRRAQELMRVWNPIGFTAGDLMAVMGEPRHRWGTVPGAEARIRYSFDNGVRGVAFDFLFSGVRDVQAESVITSMRMDLFGLLPPPRDQDADAARRALIAELRDAYGGTISGHLEPRYPEPQEHAERVARLMRLWNPVGGRPSDVVAIMGEPTREWVSTATGPRHAGFEYVFEHVYGGTAWGFLVQGPPIYEERVVIGVVAESWEVIVD